MRGTHEAEAACCLDFFVSSFFVPSTFTPRPFRPRSKAAVITHRGHCASGLSHRHANAVRAPPPPVGAGRCSCFPHCIIPYAAKGP